MANLWLTIVMVHSCRNLEESLYRVCWINVRDPLYFLGLGIPYIYVKRILFSSLGNVGYV